MIDDCVAQDKNSIWCFGDSAGIDFSDTTNPVPISTIMRGRGSCTSISDNTGNLLFYAYTRATILGNTTEVISTNDSLMQNGGNIVGQGWYRELAVINDPGDSNQYYLFSIGETNSGDEGLYYSKINMTQHNGYGAVIQKNVQLLPYQMQDGLQAIKHGNGRDWWIICHRWDVPTNEFHRFLVTPTGIQGPFVQSIGDTSFGGFLNITFSKSGSQAAVVDYFGLFEILNFDRCSGNFSINPFYTFPVTAVDHAIFWHTAFSSSEKILYISTNEQTSYLFQLNLLDSNPVATKDTLWTQANIMWAGGNLRLAPDNKIYLTCAWNDGLHYNYPYPDSAFYLENENLSVVNNPDLLGASCNFQPYSFYLGGKRTYWGLPNNPDYMLGADTTSICDTILSVFANNGAIESSTLNIYYHVGWEIVFVNASGLRGKNFLLSVFDLMGRLVYSEDGNLASQYFSKDLSCFDFKSGMYLVNIKTDAENIVKGFIKE